MKREMIGGLVLVVLLLLSVFAISIYSGARAETHSIVSVLPMISYSSLTSSNSGESPPAYVFNGAYATYQMSGEASTNVYNVSFPFSFEITYTISDVNAVAESFDVSITFGGNLSIFNVEPITVSATFSNPSPFPVESSTDLSLIDQGQCPPDLGAGSVTTNIPVSVTAGAFTVNKISLATSTLYVEPSTGLMIQTTGLWAWNYVPISETSSEDIELQSTNIPIGNLSIPSAPQLSAFLSPPQLTIQQGVATATSTLSIQNIGGGVLSWSIASSASWMSFSQTQGNVNSGESTPVAIQIQTASLTTGAQQGSMAIQSNGGQQTLTLSAIVESMTIPILAPPAAQGQPYSITFETGSSVLPSDHTATITINGQDYQWNSGQFGSGSFQISVYVPQGTSYLPFTITVLPNDYSVSPDSGNIPVYPASLGVAPDFVVQFYRGSTLPTTVGPNSGEGASGDPMNFVASLSKNQNGLYDFELQLTPQSGDLISLTQTQADAITSQIIQKLQGQQFTSTQNSQIVNTNALADFFDSRGVQFMDDLWTLYQLVPSALNNINDAGISGVAFTAEDIYINRNTPSVEQWGINAANGLISTISSYEEQLLTYRALLDGQPYSPDYIAGDGQQILIMITNLSFTGSTLPDNVNFNINGENAYRLGTLGGPDSGGNYNFYSATFSNSFSMDKGFQFFDIFVNTGFLTHDYSTGLIPVQGDPITPYIETLADNVLLNNLSFNSSRSTLSANASLVDSRMTGNMTVIVPLSLDPSNSSTFLFTFNGPAIPCDSFYLPDYGYYLTVNITGNGLLTMQVPSLSPAMVVSENAGTLLISGDGFPPDVPLSLMYFGGANWINLTNEPMMTSVTGDFCFNTTSILTTNSTFVTFRANSTYGNTAYASITAESLAYTVSEFPSTLILSLFVIATLLAAIFLGRHKRPRALLIENLNPTNEPFYDVRWE